MQTDAIWLKIGTQYDFNDDYVYFTIGLFIAEGKGNIAEIEFQKFIINGMNGTVTRVW